jgi:hypothetical protein
MSIAIKYCWSRIRKTTRSSVRSCGRAGSTCNRARRERRSDAGRTCAPGWDASSRISGCRVHRHGCASRSSGKRPRHSVHPRLRGIGEETAAAVMKAGASDYVMKKNLARLARRSSARCRGDPARRAPRGATRTQEERGTLRDLVETAATYLHPRSARHLLSVNELPCGSRIFARRAAAHEPRRSAGAGGRASFRPIWRRSRRARRNGLMRVQTEGGSCAGGVPQYAAHSGRAVPIVRACRMT